MATIKEIKAILESIDSLDHPTWASYEADGRKGVERAVRQRKKTIQANHDEETRLENMLTYEKSLYAEDYELIAGIDEVGRGPLAGPVVAACVVLPKNEKIVGLDDSKKIPKKKHDAIYQEVLKRALAVGVGIVEASVIDSVNIYEATKLAMLAALDDLPIRPNYLLIDAMKLDCPIPQQSLIKGDATSLSIAAASIVAKVKRDQLMAEYDSLYPGYGFTKNAGYGTQKHIEGLSKLGITPIHRQSFEPVKSLIEGKGL